MIKQDRHLFKGLNMDSARSIHSQEYLVGAQNIRISSSRAGTLLAVTSFKGNKSVKLYSYTKDEQGNITGYETYNGDKISGICLGSVVLNNYLILFVHESEGVDVIYRLTLITEGEENGGFLVSTLAKGDMNWDLEHPIEAIPYYELDTLQTVYYVDGKNPLKKIYIDDSHIEEGSIQESETDLTGQETFSIQKIAGGQFPPGTVQYAFTYLNPNGIETPLVLISNLQFTVINNTAYGPDETVPVAFNVTINNVNTKYAYLRLYAVVKTQNNATPQSRIVRTVQLDESSTTVTIMDDGMAGSTVDNSSLLLNNTGSPIGGTIGFKDDLLFLGNISETYNAVEYPTNAPKLDTLTTISWINTPQGDYYEYDRNQGYPLDRGTSTYDSRIKTFKYNEHYRIALQFQSANGLWTEPIELGNPFIVDKHPEKSYNTGIKVVHGQITLTANEVLSEDFVAVRPLVIYPNGSQRRVLAQGVVSPTVFNIQQRANNSAYAVSSWFFRPNSNIADNYTISSDLRVNNLYNNRYNISDYTQYNNTQQNGIWYEFRHMMPLPGNWHKNAEIQSITYPPMISNPGDKPNFNRKPDVANYPNYVEGDEKLLDFTNINQWSEYFYVDSNILTFHSPDTEFDITTQQILQQENLAIRLVGVVPCNYTTSYCRITGTPTTAALTYHSGAASIYNFWGLYNNPNTQVLRDWNGTTSDKRVYGALGVVNMFIDMPCNWQGGGFGRGSNFYNFAIYPWHRNGSLNNYSTSWNADDVPVATGEFDQKFMSNLRVAKEVNWFSTPLVQNITAPGIWQSSWSANNILNLDITGIQSNITNITYKGAYDFLSTVTRNHFLDNAQDSHGNVHRAFLQDKTEVYSYYTNDLSHSEYTTAAEYNTGYNLYEGQRAMPDGLDDQICGGDYSANALEFSKYYGYPICASFISGLDVMEETTIQLEEHLRRGAYRWISWVGFLNPNQYTHHSDTSDAGSKIELRQMYGSEPVPIQFKSGTHAVFALKSGSPNIVNILPERGIDDTDYQAFWESNNTPCNGAHMGQGNSSYSNYEGLFLAEIYNPNVIWEVDNNVVETWNIGGPSVQLNEAGNTIIELTEGDTYFQRYDCLKTYQYNTEAKNNIVEIYSFLCETRVNLEGRYDTNQGTSPDNTVMNPNNFNIVNQGYTQNNQFFAQADVENIGAESDTFRTSIIWSEPKINGEEVDSWLQFNSTSIYNLDGSLGSVTALKKFNNELYVFQEGGIGQILYNNRVQIPASDGMPIEITNSQRVQGVRYLTVNGGCQNKWAITQSKHGIWFIDNRQSSFNLFDGNNITDITQQQGMRSWINNNNLSLEPWNLVNTQSFNNYRLFYDQTLDDLFIVGNTLETSPYYSTLTQSFNSFVNYENTSFMLNLRDNFYGIKQNGNSFNVWMQNDGDYLDFYDTRQPLSISFISNQDEPLDKTFDWIEYRADALTTEDKVNPNESFTHIDVENEYQKGSEKLSYRSFTYPESKDEVDTKWKLSSNLKRKFRIWRALIPRDNSQQGKPALNRMRNPWLKITLTKEADPETVIPNMFALYDLSVQYSI